MLEEDVFSICADCAHAKGAMWPDGHVATFWNAMCDVCEEEKGVCDVSDWTWPRSKRRFSREF